MIRVSIWLGTAWKCHLEPKMKSRSIIFAGINVNIESFSLEPAFCEYDPDSVYGVDYEYYSDTSRKRARELTECGECSYDYLQISYGSVEEKYCGSDLPGPITSSGNTMTVTFVSDGIVQYKGFTATWGSV